MSDDLIVDVQQALSKTSEAIESQLENRDLTEPQRQAMRNLYQALRDWQFKAMNAMFSDADRPHLRDFVEKVERNELEIQSTRLAGGTQDFATAMDHYRDALGSLLSAGTHGSGEGEPL